MLLEFKTDISAFLLPLKITFIIIACIKVICVYMCICHLCAYKCTCTCVNMHVEIPELILCLPYLLFSWFLEGVSLTGSGVATSASESSLLSLVPRLQSGASPESLRCVIGIWAPVFTLVDQALCWPSCLPSPKHDFLVLCCDVGKATDLCFLAPLTIKWE